MTRAVSSKKVSICLRSTAEVGEGIVFPTSIYFEPYWKDSLRLLAVMEVLRRLPVDAYDALENAASDFAWFIPEPDMQGGVRSFVVSSSSLASYNQKGMEEAAVEIVRAVQVTDRPNPLIRKSLSHVLFLAPVLDRSAWDIAVAVVAYELARILLGHPLINYSPDEYMQHEEDALTLATEWGFVRETRKLRAVNAARTTRKRAPAITTTNWVWLRGGKGKEIRKEQFCFLRWI